MYVFVGGDIHDKIGSVLFTLPGKQEFPRVRQGAGHTQPSAKILLKVASWTNKIDLCINNAETSYKQNQVARLSTRPAPMIHETRFYFSRSSNFQHCTTMYTQTRLSQLPLEVTKKLDGVRLAIQRYIRWHSPSDTRNTRWYISK
jgi:hypothetical protein